MRILHTALKMTLVTIIAGLISKWVGLDYWLTGGILAVLSIQPTKRDSVHTAFKRIIDVFFAMILATLLFSLLGYHFWVFVIVVFVFSFISFQLNISEGIVPALVIVTHLLIYGKFSFPFFLEESLLVLISIGIATLFNSFYPEQGKKILKKYVVQIDQHLKDHLLILSFLIKDPEYHEVYSKHYHLLEKELTNIMKQVERVNKDVLFQNDQSYLAYAQMRQTQALSIKHMYDQALTIETAHKYAVEISDVIKNFSYELGLHQETITHLNLINELLKKYKKSELPKTREEFESRATLYQVLLELKSLLKINLRFHDSFPDFLS